MLTQMDWPFSPNNDDDTPIQNEKKSGESNKIIKHLFSPFLCFCMRSISTSSLSSLNDLWMLPSECHVIGVL